VTKAEKRHPWLKWYPADWRADPALRMCSLAARGLWADMLGLMHEAEPYGYLVVGGRLPTSQQLASLVGVDVRAVTTALGELEAAGVFSRDAEGRIYSRRMVRDKAKSDQDRQNGKGGGNPSLRRPDKVGVNPPDNGQDKGAVKTPDKAQKPEARDTSSQSSDGASAAPPPDGQPPLDQRAELFGPGLGRLRRMTGRPDGASRAILGRLLREVGDDCALLNRLLFEAEDARPADPVAWISAAILSRTGRRAAPSRSGPDRDWAARELAHDLLGSSQRFDIDGQAEVIQ